MKEVVSDRGLFGTQVGAVKSDTLTYTDKDVKDFLAASVCLIRYIIEMGGELEARIYLRNQFTICGLNSVFRVKYAITSIQTPSHS